LVCIMICVAAAPTAVLQALCMQSSRDVTTMAPGAQGVEVHTKLQHRHCCKGATLIQHSHSVLSQRMLLHVARRDAGCATLPAPKCASAQARGAAVSLPSAVRCC
jgi:hypothetical protein